MCVFFTAQKTLNQDVSCHGIGVHCNAPITLTFKPADVDMGIVFVRSDLYENNVIPAAYDLVQDTRFCTILKNQAGVSISTVEHVMAALAAFSITNLIVEVSGPEMPIMDGSSKVFVDMIQQAGIKNQGAAMPFIRIIEKVEITEDNRFVCLEPAPDFTIAYGIDFNGRQNLAPQNHVFHCSSLRFVNTICQARSFGFLEDAEKLWALGLAKGSSLDNAVVIDQGYVMNEDGLRYANEMVRHKILDALGDLALAGVGIQGRLTTHNGGHEMNNRILRHLFANPHAYEIVYPPHQSTVVKQMTSPSKHIAQKRESFSLTA